ncbi:succinate dehydrogenase, hydrophobic membrane anchor protein [Thiohalorhabdus methylotrophus]|uniref:Succinate dehydrogenase hydrophobic membrane anchor subunit n=1 Tax=Thiohalorhabdus methylotrophus TaxID=3242694 RepID=A0ABV4TZY7_9GAMM
MFRDLGASRTGLGAWWWQRVTAVYLAGFLVVGLVWLGVAPPESYQQWRSWLANPGLKVALMLFVVTVAVHAYVGLRDVFMDYVPRGPVRIAVFVLWTAAVAAFIAWGMLWVTGL